MSEPITDLMCSDCRGKGSYPGLDITCRSCHGSGVETDLIKIAKYEVIEAAKKFKAGRDAYIAENISAWPQRELDNLLAAVALLESREGKK